VAFPPEGGNRWSVINAEGFFNRGIPDECHDKMREFHRAGERVVAVAFPPAGGNRWSVITKDGFFNRGIGDECHDKMREFHRDGEKVVCVAFPFAGGNRYTIVGERGRFFNRSSPRGCHRVMRAMNNSRVGAIHMVGFHPDGGYAIVSDASPAGQVTHALTENGKTFSIDTFAENLKNQLAGKVVKYAFMVRYKNAMRAWAAGPKRTADNPPEQAFTVFDWFNPASVTKVVTAVGLLHCVNARGLTTGEPIGGHLPRDWRAPRLVRAITVEQLLSHRAGFRGGAIKYDDLKAMVEAGIDPANQAVREYENCNYGLARIVLAMMSGLEIGDDDPEEATAARFRSYIQDHVFDEMGIPGVEWKPDADDPTEFYPDPPEDSGGTSYGDWTLRPGSAGVHLSIAELSIFVARLADGNDLLPEDLRAAMDAAGLGWDTEHGPQQRKGGFFPGSKNGGAELHATIGKFINGIQYAVVYNGRYAADDPAPFDLNAAYDAAWA
jgi:CubicO group peptidase (beta-lactamase class C family)